MNPPVKSSLKNKSIIRTVFTTFLSALWIFLIISILLKLFVFQQVTVVGPSMEPNYYTGQGLIVNQIDKNFDRGQVVAVFKDRELAKTANFFTKFQATIYLKRIIALPGESIEMINDKVIIYNSDYPSGKVLSETYLGANIIKGLKNERFYFPKTLISPETYFLMGDNRINSQDSRNLGAFPKASLFGQEVLRFWPWPAAEIFSRPNYTFSDMDIETKNALVLIGSGRL